MFYRPSLDGPLIEWGKNFRQLGTDGAAELNSFAEVGLHGEGDGTHVLAGRLHVACCFTLEYFSFGKE